MNLENKDFTKKLKANIKSAVVFNRKRFASSIKSLMEIYQTIRMSRFWWPSIFSLIFVLFSSFVNLHSLSQDKKLILIQGERFVETNFEYEIRSNQGFYQGKSLELKHTKLPNELDDGEIDDEKKGYYYALFKFNVLEKDDYWILLGGTPPGPAQAQNGSEWHCPYWISFDNEEPVQITAEHVQTTFPNHPKNTEYIMGGYHWIKIGSRILAEGEHTLEIRVLDKRDRDDKYVLFIDAILLAPKGWQPVRLFKGLPHGLFAEE